MKVKAPKATRLRNYVVELIWNFGENPICGLQPEVEKVKVKAFNKKSAKRKAIASALKESGGGFSVYVLDAYRKA